MQTITITDLKNDIGKYVSLANNEDIIITKNGKPVSKLTSISENNRLARLAAAETLV